jgi:hypothetical protein
MLYSAREDVCEYPVKAIKWGESRHVSLLRTAIKPADCQAWFMPDLSHGSPAGGIVCSADGDIHSRKHADGSRFTLHPSGGNEQRI